MKKFILFLAIIFLMIPFISFASLANDLSGRILLQVEKNGEAWYVNPDNNNRYFMGRPSDAFSMMRQFGLGITNEDLNKIPIGLIAQSGEDYDKDGLVDLLETAIGTNPKNKDTDGDGYTDKEEIENGYNPKGPGKFPELIDQKLINQVKGKILLQVEDHGEAWYVNPVNGKRYFLGRPVHAFEIMRSLGLGITNNDIDKIPVKILMDIYNNRNDITLNYPKNWYLTETDGANRLIKFIPSTRGNIDTDFEIFFHTTSNNQISDSGSSIMLAKVTPNNPMALKDFSLQKKFNEEIINEKDIIIDNHSAKKYIGMHMTEGFGTKSGHLRLQAVIMNNAKEFYIVTMNSTNQLDQVNYLEDLFDQVINSIDIK